MSEKNGQGAAPRRKLYRFEDMAFQRDAVEIGGKEYELRSASEIGAEDMATIVSLEEAVAEAEAREATDAKEIEQRAADMFHMLKERTRIILFTEVDDDVLDNLSVAMHAFIYTSFWQASAEDGTRLQAAMEATKARVRS